ncbi:hypothetical protein FJZ26_04645 [Candidatus Parvarchaeota archaeon]|nr:hypothetical protein [Candidatus Parvarchaeota archaeon]
MASIRAKIPMLDACEITNANISVTDAGNPGNDFRVKILGTNSCENDGAKKINLKTFGICEPCTTATMAQEKIGATSNYCPMAWQSNNFPQDPNLANAGNNWYNNGHGGNAYNNLGTVGNSRAIRLCKQAEWDDCGGHDEEDRSCDSASSLCGGYSCQKYGGWPTLTPEVTYMREKLKAYLTSNILPIIDMGDIGWSPYRRPYIDKNPNSNLVKYPCENSYEIMSGFYRHSHTVSGTSCAQNYHTSYDSAPECANDSVSIISPPLIYHDGNDCTLTNAFFKEGLGQLGTMVVNVGEVPQAGSGGDAARADLLKKAQGARGQCPNCLVGVHVSGSGVSTDAENINKLNKLFGWQDLGPYSASYNFTALDSIDLVFIDFYPHSYTSENPLLCSDPVSILSKRMNFTRTLLNHYQKPSLINHFNINESAIPDSVSTNANELEVYFWNSDTSTYRTGDGNPILTSSGTRIGTYYVTNGWVSDCSGHSGNYFGDVSLVFDPSVVQHASANITGVYSDDGYKIWPDDNNNVIQNGWTCDSGSQGWFSYNSPTYRYWGNTASQVWFYRVIDNHPPTTQLNLRFRVAYQPVISDTCWAPDNMERMMSYMFNQTSEMVGAGIIGVMYDKWDTDWSGAADGRGLRLKRAGGEDTQGDKFCSFQVNSRKVLGLSTNTFFQKVYPAAACTCQKCSDLDIRAGKCNPTCLTGATCTGVANTDGYKCPDNCYTIQTCPLCSTSASTYTCVTQTDSGKTTRPVAANTLTSPIYGNIIASLPQKCCIQETLPDDSKLNYTFVKSEATRQRNALVIYPKDGNPLADCASNPAALDTQACGFSLPLTKAKITCY